MEAANIRPNGPGHHLTLDFHTGATRNGRHLAYVMPLHAATRVALLKRSSICVSLSRSSQLHSDRDSIPDVPAIYFCAATEENLGRIAQDFQSGLYDVYHLNFISPISRQKLEDLAAAALQAGCVANIHKVYDQYLNFITLEDDMFVLKHQNSDSLSYYGELREFR